VLGILGLRRARVVGTGSAQDITVRDDLTQLTGDLEAALAQATARERVSALTRAALTSAATATARLCP
jgi:hypothetical protein